nr:MAG TPA: hypothetical protein [Caudoviricetes sp.]
MSRWTHGSIVRVINILYNWNDKRLKSIKNLDSSSTVAHL